MMDMKFKSKEIKKNETDGNNENLDIDNIKINKTRVNFRNLMVNKKRKPSDNGIRLFFFFSIVVVILIFFLALPRLSIPLSFAYIIGLIIEQVVRPLMQIGFKRFQAFLLIGITIVFLLVYPLYKIIPSMESEMDNYHNYIPKVDKFIRVSYSKVTLKIKEKVGVQIQEKHLDNFLNYTSVESKNLLLQIPNFLASFFEWIFLVPLILFFLLKDGREFRFSFLKLVPNTIFERTYFLIYQFHKQLGNYIFAKFVEASIVGTITTVGLWCLDMKFSILLGGIAAITNIVPYVGPLLGIVPAVILASVEHGVFSSMTAAVAILFIVANVIDIAFVFPLLVSKIVDLHPLVVVISVILGSQYMGIVGMIVSIPVAAILKLIFAEIYKELYPIISRQEE
ncbi:MAG: AI-2E family transporter [Oligoflexia bacterium]|nr:AI-2E family transporter [Oligoflexia bacterium]